MGYRISEIVVASAARTATGQSSEINVEQGSKIHLFLDVTAVSGGTPTLNVSLEWSFDGGTTWAAVEPADSFAQITAVAKTMKSFDVKAPHYRIKWTIAGTTPSFTFSMREFVTGSAL